jgi:hypothetical protein
MNKLNPDIDGPKYGIPFRIVGFQALTEKGKYTELIETSGEEFNKLKCRKDYLKWKEETSRMICDGFNKMLKIKWDKIVSFKVKYLCETDDHYI